MEGLLVPHLHQYQPCIIPTAITLRIIAHSPLRIVECITTERVIPGQTAELVE
jgi:hypothetical protein